MKPNRFNVFGRQEEPKQTNFGEELRKVVQSKGFEEKLTAVAPFLVTSLIAWPTFWMYRGLDWNKRRGIESLPVYIRKTFFQAKVIQLLIISTGILVAINKDTREKLLEVQDA